MMFLITFSENDKRLLIALAIFLIVFFVLIAYIAKLIRYIMRKYGRAVDNYMYDMCYYKVINDPKTFTKYVKQRENKSLYFRSKWFIRIFLLTTAGFLAFALLRDHGDESTFAFFHEALDGLTIKFTGWQKTKVFGLTIPSDFPQVKRGFEPVLTLPGIISYIYLFITVVNVFAIVNASLIYISRMIRCKQAVGEVYQKKLSNLSEISANNKK